MATNTQLYRLTEEEFASCVSRSFDFLKDLGFALLEKKPAKPFTIAFANKTTRVQIEGHGYGSDVVVLIGPRDGERAKDLVPLWALSRTKKMSSNASAVPLSDGDQLAQIAANSNFISSDCRAILDGDFSSLGAAHQAMLAASK